MGQQRVLVSILCISSRRGDYDDEDGGGSLRMMARHCVVKAEKSVVKMLFVVVGGVEVEKTGILKV